MVPGERRKKTPSALLIWENGRSCVRFGRIGRPRRVFSKMEICRLCWRTVSIGFFFLPSPFCQWLDQEEGSFFCSLRRLWKVSSEWKFQAAWQLRTYRKLCVHVLDFFFCVCFEQGKVPKCEDKRPKSILASGSMHSKRIDFFLGKLNWQVNQCFCHFSKLLKNLRNS